MWRSNQHSPAMPPSALSSVAPVFLLASLTLSLALPLVSVHTWESASVWARCGFPIIPHRPQICEEMNACSSGPRLHDGYYNRRTFSLTYPPHISTCSDVWPPGNMIVSVNVCMFIYGSKMTLLISRDGHVWLTQTLGLYCTDLIPIFNEKHPYKFHFMMTSSGCHLYHMMRQW